MQTVVVLSGASSVFLLQQANPQFGLLEVYHQFKDESILRAPSCSRYLVKPHKNCVKLAERVSTNRPNVQLVSIHVPPYHYVNCLPTHNDYVLRVNPALI